MARYKLIDTYLNSLADRVRWRADRDEIIAEARDHLYSTAERFEADGDTHRNAQIATLHRYGSADQVAVALATTDAGKLAVPTESTRGAGFGAMVAAVAWVAFIACWLISGAVDSGNDWSGAAQAWFMIGTVFLMAAAALTVLVMWFVRERHGGLGPLGLVGLGIAALGAVATVISWFFFGWASLLGMGALLVAIPMLQRGLAPRWATIAFAAAWPIAAILGSTLRWLEVGSPDEWGDYWVANFAGLTTGAALSAVGLLGLGRWLRSEEPVDLPAPETLART